MLNKGQVGGDQGHVHHPHVEIKFPHVEIIAGVVP